MFCSKSRAATFTSHSPIGKAKDLLAIMHTCRCQLLGVAADTWPERCLKQADGLMEVCNWDCTCRAERAAALGAHPVCNIACMCAPLGHCSAGKANCSVESCYVHSTAQLQESSCSCDSTSAAVKAPLLQQTMSFSFSRFTNKETTKQEILTGCLLSCCLELIYCVATHCRSHSPCCT